MMRENEILSVDRLQVGFKNGRDLVVPIRDVSFSMRAGKTHALVGESGCGKTVTAHTIIKLLPRNAKVLNGKIEYKTKSGGIVETQNMSRFGKEACALRGKEIGIIFQDPMASLNPVYRIGDQIIEALRQHERISKSQAIERVCDLLKALGIPEARQRLNDYPHQFSGGMKQRVIIAIAMICSPDLLIADEPTTALDATIQAQILELLYDMQQKFGTSILLITHNIGIVAEMADDISIMYMGRVVETGNGDDILSNPLHPYTRGLLRSVPLPGANRKELLHSIPGNTPDLYRLTDGCAFKPRCEFATDKCDNEPPEFDAENGHKFCCWKHEEGIPRD